MKNSILYFFIVLFPLFNYAQKKPLDHSVYDRWERINSKSISDNGNWVVYEIAVQEGDGNLVVQSTKELKNSHKIPRGYDADFTPNGEFLIFKIKPAHQAVRQAKIKKKKPENSPQDSLGILNLEKGTLLKFPDIKSYKIPKENSEWIVFQQQEFIQKKEKSERSTDQLEKTIDSLQQVIRELKKGEEIDLPQTAKNNVEEKGKRLVLYHLKTDNRIEFAHTGSYEIDENANYLSTIVYERTKDSYNHSAVIRYSLKNRQTDTLVKNINEAKSFAFTKDGDFLAFLAESGKKSKIKTNVYSLYGAKSDQSSAAILVDTNSARLPQKYSVSEFGKLYFSEDNTRLVFGVAPIPPAKDTSLADIDRVNVDVWHYKDDYLQPQQLKNSKREKERNYLSVYDLKAKDSRVLGTAGLPQVMTLNEAKAKYFIGITDTNRRVSTQWTGYTLKDIYRIDVNSGEKKMIKKNLNGRIFYSPKGEYVVWYDAEKENYFSHHLQEQFTNNITADLSVPLYDELNDRPMDPMPYGIMGWSEKEEAVFIYDRYDVWKIDLSGKKKSIRITPNGRATQQVYRYRKTDPEERYLQKNQRLIFSIFNEIDKSEEIAQSRLKDRLLFQTISKGDFAYSRAIAKAINADEIVYTKENFQKSPDLYVFKDGNEVQLSAINPQQSQYNWGYAELFKWTTFEGKESTGIVYKPEDFDATKKYPVIAYFYERRSDSFNEYLPPEPTRSKLDISFFVSRGYVVFVPDIAYTVGYPGESAYDYILSGVQELAKNDWIDEKNMGIQGQSWGGYQVAHLITRTDLFKAAWAGAPVVNMFSAYGGIRWGTGLNRQFQYEKTQSRIGATLWEQPELYQENSPLFYLDKVNTPVVIMHNDNDGAVPWYQGIEMFTALRRLGKPVWMLNYNGEEHNLLQRKNKKDIQIRQQQFFDYLLKDQKAPKWITKGVPAIDKGIDWGLEIED